MQVIHTVPNRTNPSFIRTLASTLTFCVSLFAAPHALAQSPEPAGVEQVEVDRDALLEAISQTYGAAVQAGEISEDEAAAVVQGAAEMSDDELIAFATELGLFADAEAQAGAGEIDRGAAIEAITQVISAGVEAGQFTAEEGQQTLDTLPNMSDDELVAYGTQIGAFAAEGEAGAGAEGLAAAIDPAMLEAACMFEDKPKAVACIVERLEAARVTSFDKASEARVERAGEKTSLALGIVMLLMFAAPLFMLLPFIYGKRVSDPNDKREMFKWSALAGGLYVVNLVLFGIALLVLRTFQAVGGSQTDPKIAVIDGTFRTLLKNADGFSDSFGMLVAPALNAGEDIVGGLLGHFQTLVANAEVLIKFAERFQSLQGLLDNVGLLFAIIAVVLFGLGFKESFVRIIKLPLTILEARKSGDAEAAKTASKDALGYTLREMKVVGAFLGAIVVVTTVSGLLLKTSIVPTTENMVGQLLVALFYMMSEPETASAGAIGLGLGSAVFTVILAVVLTLACSGMYLSRTQKLLRAYFQQGVSLQDHWKFFAYGGLIIIAIQLFPYIYMSGTSWAIEQMLAGYEAKKEVPPFAFMLRAISPMVAVGWLVTFWAARGHKGLLWIAKYPVPKPGDEAQA